MVEIVRHGCMLAERPAPFHNGFQFRGVGRLNVR